MLFSSLKKGGTYLLDNVLINSVLFKRMGKWGNPGKLLPPSLNHCQRVWTEDSTKSNKRYTEGEEKEEEEEASKATPFSVMVLGVSFSEPLSKSLD